MSHFTYAVSDFITALNLCEGTLCNEKDARARWFASVLRDVLPVAREVYSATLSQANRIKVVEFQLKEVADAKVRAEAELARLNKEEEMLLPRLEQLMNEGQT